MRDVTLELKAMNHCGIDQDDLVSFFAEGLVGLGAGIVEFASLSDDNRACSDDENFFDAGILGHVFRAV